MCIKINCDCLLFLHLNLINDNNSFLDLVRSLRGAGKLACQEHYEASCKEVWVGS